MNRALIAIGLTLGLLAGCGDKPARPACPPGKLCLHVGNMAEPTTLDPQKSTTVQADNIIGDLFVGLVTHDAESKAIPGMATSWTTSPDGLVWTFKMRDAVWSDGVPATADDFVYTMQRLQDPATTAEYSYLAYVIKNAEAVNTGKLPVSALGVKALDPHTLQMTLEHPAPYLPELLKHNAFYMTPAHTIRKWGDSWMEPGHFVSNGPFVLQEWKLGNPIHLLKNPRFYDAANVCLDEVYYYATNDSVSAERRVRRGELHANVDIQSNRIAFLKKEAPEIVRTNTWLGVDYLIFNANLAPFKDVRVRQALSMAIDREFITGKLLRSGTKAAYSFVPPGVAGYPGGPRPYWQGWSLERRQAEARRLLAAAGYGPSRQLRFEVKQRNTADPLLIMPAIQADWRLVGVQADLVPNESQIAYAAYRVRDFQMADASWIADFDDASNFLDLFQSSTGVMNYGDYKNPAFDVLAAQAAREPDAAKRAALLVRSEQMVLDDAGVVPIYFYISKNLVRPEVTGWVENVPDKHFKRWICFKDAAARRKAG
jgi:oligopeptide transport system substrate-binding protein